jgi:long-chain fatty acid transport protein
MVTASGPVNRSMGGAAVAAPLDAIGAIRWNPASVSGLTSSEIGFGLDLVWPMLEIDSSIGGFGGTTAADPGVTPIPSAAWVHKIDGSALTIGLGVAGVAGFCTNYPASTTNPILMPQSNTPGVPGGFGRIYTEACFMQLAPTVSLALTDRLSVGVSPLITLGKVIVDPLVITAPNDADGSMVLRYPSGRGTRMHWGGGAQAGVFYIVNEDWRIGGAIKTPNWMEPLQFNTEDELGNPQQAEFKMDLPMIVSGGVSYAGIDDVVLALDVRYLDYENTDGFGDSGFNADGSLRGLGWNSVFALATGIQYRLMDPLFVRLGYTFNENPTPESQTAVNIAAPLHYQHEFHTGGSYQLTRNAWLHAAYTYYLEHEITGPIFTPMGVIPDSSVTSRESVHVASVGVSVDY